MKKDLIDLLKMLENKSHEISKTFEDSDFLDDPISLLWDIIGQNFGFNQEFIDSDDYGGLLYDYGAGKLSKKELLIQLNKGNNRYGKR